MPMETWMETESLIDTIPILMEMESPMTWIKIQTIKRLVLKILLQILLLQMLLLLSLLLRVEAFFQNSMVKNVMTG